MGSTMPSLLRMSRDIAKDTLPSFPAFPVCSWWQHDVAGTQPSNRRRLEDVMIMITLPGTTCAPGK